MATLRRRGAGRLLLATMMLSVLAVGVAGRVLDAEGDGDAYSPDEKTLPGACPPNQSTFKALHYPALRSANPSCKQVHQWLGSLRRACPREREEVSKGRTLRSHLGAKRRSWL